ncbi:Gfo/Idh/MocA family protein [Phytoactinopolyspora mesophila]|uniref:Gfo/Idh/MocA family oxidoreductase n=1 Tax=Phytoactinopolyspora mesophila TaxID=2650750 RepID=A0A7K3M2G6_9ACTN|nr:Gfo/Idh/MocA family oxidoreductase [Phytoactinopolyspora mesophila]NDL57449.1 gfo/Idh/MocA family oxidoreductase [Phytoactinopolyspora mesophila]
MCTEDELCLAKKWSIGLVSRGNALPGGSTRGRPMSGIRIGLIGAGGIATRHLPAWLSLGAEVVVYSERGARELTERFGGTAVASLDELLECCDVVDVVTPTPVHRVCAETALRAGKDVICEKPLARHHDDAVAMARLADQEGRQLLPAHVVRFRAEYAAMRAAVHEGRIGVPAVARYSRTAPFPAWSSWFADPQESGGVVLDLLIHDLDIAHWVCGEVTEVYAVTSQAQHQGTPTATAHAVLTHANGAISHVTGTWGAPGIRLTTSYHVSGTHGVLSFDSAAEHTIRLNTPDGAGAPDVRAGGDPFLGELREFSRAIGGGPPARLNARDGIIAVDLALAALESIRTGKAVPFLTWNGGW